MAEEAAHIAPGEAPAALRRRLSREGWLNLALALMLLAAPLAAVALGEPYYASLASRVAILALAGVGLNLALGRAGQPRPLRLLRHRRLRGRRRRRPSTPSRL